MSYDPAAKRPPIVTDANRQWAIDQKPESWDAEAPHLDWETHVAEQAERFERHFGDDRKPAAEWSGLLLKEKRLRFDTWRRAML